MTSDFPNGIVEIVRSFNKLVYSWPFQEGTVKIAIFPSSRNFCNTFKTEE
jgi:hypothetical protein